MKSQTDAQKQCSRCKTIKPASEFSPDNRSKDKLSCHCKKCRCITTKKYKESEAGRATVEKWREENKDRINAKRRQEAYDYRHFTARYKLRCRDMLTNAVRRGYIPRPEGKTAWEEKWNFHHPDYTRPFYGVWLLRQQHDDVDHGKAPCPVCTDYTEHVFTCLMRDHGFLGGYIEDITEAHKIACREALIALAAEGLSNNGK